MAQYKGDSRDAKRARKGAKQQEEMKEAFQRKIQEMRDETEKHLHNMQLGHMFSLQENVSEKNFNDAIVGLQTHDEYKNKFNKYIKNRENTDGESKKKSKKSKDKKNKKNKKKRKQINNLSFDFDSDNEREITPKSTKKKKKKKKKKIQDSEKDKDKKDETTDNIATNTTETNDSNTKINEQQNSNEKNNNGGGVDDSGDSGDKSKSFDSVDSVELSGFEEPPKKRRKLNKTKTSKNKNKSRKIGKNPNVDTSFLPDADRDAEDLKLRESLEKEWSKEQNLIKKERLEITYSYWDGSGHRRTIEIAKGIKIGDFLELVRKELSSQFSELRGLSGDHLMYIKDDLIIPQNFTFYDLIVSGARGLSNNYMFKNQTFDKGDYTIDKDGGHPGKVITRAWYDRNKHIFPASKWEVYDPTNAQNGTSK